MKNYAQLTQSFLSQQGLERVYVRNQVGELRLRQISKAAAERLVKSGKAVRG